VVRLALDLGIYELQDREREREIKTYHHILYPNSALLRTISVCCRQTKHRIRGGGMCKGPPRVLTYDTIININSNKEEAE
jgi:hypothetical protein